MMTLRAGTITGAAPIKRSLGIQQATGVTK